MKHHDFLKFSANGNQTSRTEGSQRDETIQEQPNQLAMIVEYVFRIRSVVF